MIPFFRDVRARLVRPTPLEWFALLVGLFLTNHYAWIMDDAFVYFRYVDNLLFLGNGLVYNQGEFVEGYSSALWCLLLVVLRATTLDYWVMVRILGALIWAAFWWLAVLINHRLSPEGRRFNAPLLFLCANYGVICYFTSGLETPLVQLSAALFAYALLTDKPSRALMIALALTPLVRYELVLPLGVVGLWWWARNRRLPWTLLLTAVLSMGAWLLFKVYYYAELLPNTFYLKDNVDPWQGLIYLNDTCLPYGVYVLVPLGAAAFVWLARRSSWRALFLPERLLMLLAAALVAAYVIKIGGDPRHYRYLAFPFCLGALAFGGLAEGLLNAWHAERRAWLAPILGVLLIAGSLCLLPRQLTGHPLLMTDRAEFVQKIGDASNHRRNASLAFLNPWGGAMDARLHMLDQYEAALAKGPFRYRTRETGNWCFTNYLHFDRRVLHDLGLTDSILAHATVGFNRPAHKFGLLPLAKDLLKLYDAAKEEPRRGTVRRGLAKLTPPPAWVPRNLDTIEVIERKVYNTHDFAENLSLALTFPPRITL